jgi:hypothetical protein
MIESERKREIIEIERVRERMGKENECVNERRKRERER